MATKYSDQLYTYDSIQAEYLSTHQSVSSPPAAGQSPVTPVRPVVPAAGTLPDPNATYTSTHLRAARPTWRSQHTHILHGLLNVSLLLTSIFFILILVYKYCLTRLIEQQKAAIRSALLVQGASKSWRRTSSSSSH